MPQSAYGVAPNVWLHSPETGYDISRGSSSTKSLESNKGPCKIDPASSALIVIDMQNFFLHPEIRAHPTGLAAMDKLLEFALPASREAGVKVLWVNWGLSQDCIDSMPPIHASSFGAIASDRHGKAGFGSVMSDVAGVDAGRLLMRDQWNSACYGELQTSFEEGEKAGTDVWIHKNRMSGLWGTSTLLEEYLVRNGIKTLFFTGVNTDQCVSGSFFDSYSKGYDSFLIKDCCGTNSPDACRVGIEYNAGLVGFTLDTAEYAKGLRAP